jgi:DNA-binding NtrC family response regulator
MTQSTILIAVENDVLRRKLNQCLLLHGYGILEASGQDAILQSFQDYKPNLLIVESTKDDDKSPLEAAEQIRQCDRRFPIILLADQGCEALAVAALRIGVKDYFKQPFELEKIITAVNRCLSDRPPLTVSPENKSRKLHLPKSQQMGRAQRNPLKKLVVST